MDSIDDMLEILLEDVFGERNKLSMKEFVKTMTCDQNWLFDSELCRKQATSFLN